MQKDTGDERGRDSIPELGRSSGVGNGNPLQYSCLGYPITRGAWWAVVQGVVKSDTAEVAEHAYTQGW